MKLFRHFYFGLQAAVVLVCFGLVAARGANTNTVPGKAKTNAAKAAGSAAATNTGPVELPVPHSTFDVTIKPTKDPFFPLSMRQPVPSATNALAFSASAFALKGLSGPNGHRLALINNRTLGVGESTELTTAAGKTKIRCLDIRESSVLIRVGAQPEPIEIFLRKAAQ